MIRIQSLILVVLCISTGPSAAQTAVVEQPFRALAAESQANSIPLFSNQLPTHPIEIDNARSKIWDNFRLDSTAALTSVEWTGAFDGPFNPALRGELDFQIQVFADQNNQPDFSAPIATWTLDGGTAGTNDGVDVRSEQIEDQFVIRGGIVSEYEADLPRTLELAAGDYWLSVVALQTFPSDNFFDPGWGWSAGLDGDGTAFRFESAVTGPEPGTQLNQDFAFRLFADVAQIQSFNADVNDDGVENAEDIDQLSALVRSTVYGTVDASGFLNIHGDGQDVLGVEFRSDSGSLLPIGDTSTDASPFDFFLANNPSQVTLGKLNVGDPGKDNGSGPLNVNGTVRLPVRFDDRVDPWTDLSASWGVDKTTFDLLVGRTSSDLNADGQIDALDRQTWIDAVGTIAGDADLDGNVGFADFLVLSASFGQTAGWANGDFDGNGSVQFGDFLLLSANFGQSQASAVPEPGSGTLVMLGVCCFVGVFRGKRWL